MNTLPQPYGEEKHELKNSFILSEFFREIYSSETQNIMVFFVEEIMGGHASQIGEECYRYSMDRFLAQFPKYSFEDKEAAKDIQNIFQEIISVTMEYKGYRKNGCNGTWGCMSIVSGIGYDPAAGTIDVELRLKTVEDTLRELHENYGDYKEATLRRIVGEERLPGKLKYTPIMKKIVIFPYTGPRYIHPNSKERKRLKALGEYVQGRIGEVTE